jgi:hypothetical protein
MDIKSITDTIFNLQETMYPLVCNEYKDSEKIYAEINKLFRQILSGILPAAEFWCDGQEKPKSEFIWAINPYIPAEVLSSDSLTSVALLQNDELIIGVHFNWHQRTTATGETGGGGAYIFEEQLLVPEKKLGPDSFTMEFTPDYWANRDHWDEAAKFFQKFRPLFIELRKNIETRESFNRVPKNIEWGIMKVIRGEYDYIYAIMFSYPQIAAIIAVFEQAGGVCTDFSGGKEKLFAGEELFCSNKLIHSEFILLAKQYVFTH